MKSERARVTIGMPVFNGEATVVIAIEALLSQSFSGFRLIISNNASTDATDRICKEYAQRDTRVAYICQQRNIGADANFDFVLAQADSEYFMWAAADDTRSPDFIESNLRFLDRHTDYVGSTCRVRFVNGDYDPVKMGDESRAEPSAGGRIARFFDTWHANGRFYSLFRRTDLVAAKQPVSRFLASDWAIVVRLLERGKLNRLDSGSVDLGVGGTSHGCGYVASFRTRGLHWAVPLLGLTLVTMRSLNGEAISHQAAAVCKLGWLNVKAVWAQLRFAIFRT